MGNSAPQTTKPYVDPAVIKCNTGYLTNTDCNADPLCYYINNGCYHKRQYSTLNNISSSDIKCSIFPDTNKSDNYLLYCINTNNIKNIVIKSIVINNNKCNNLYVNKCNILLSGNITNTEFTLKPYMQTFSIIGGELTYKPSLTIDQINLIKANNNQITLIDINDNQLIILVNVYDTNYEKILTSNQDILNKNLAIIAKTGQNINAVISQ